MAKRGDVDLLELEPRSLDRGDRVADHVALRCDEQHFHHVLVGGRHVVADDLEIEDRILDRDRDVVLRLVLDRAFEFRALHVRQVDETHDDLLVADADRRVRAAEARGAHELLDGGRDGLDIDDLPLDDGAHRDADNTVSLQPEGRRCGFELGQTDMVGPDVETYHGGIRAEGDGSQRNPQFLLRHMLRLMLRPVRLLCSRSSWYHIGAFVQQLNASVCCRAHGLAAALRGSVSFGLRRCRRDAGTPRAAPDRQAR